MFGNVCEKNKTLFNFPPTQQHVVTSRYTVVESEMCERRFLRTKQKVREAKEQWSGGITLQLVFSTGGRRVGVGGGSSYTLEVISHTNNLSGGLWVRVRSSSALFLENPSCAVGRGQLRQLHAGTAVPRLKRGLK